MRRVRLLAGLGLVLGALSVALGGADPVARALAAVGAPGTAARLAADPRLTAELLAAAGRHGGAAELYAALGQRYNEGVAAARAGDYARALAAFDAVLLADPADGEARANYAIVKAVFAGTGFDDRTPIEDRERGDVETKAEAGEGNARAAGTGDEAQNATTSFAMPELRSEGVRRVPNVFDAHYLRASERWLETMPDEPGQYLKARLREEQRAREAAGTAVPAAEDPR